MNIKCIKEAYNLLFEAIDLNLAGNFFAGFNKTYLVVVYLVPTQKLEVHHSKTTGFNSFIE